MKRFTKEGAKFAERNKRTLMTETENVVRQPGVDGPAQLVEFAGKEMIDAFDDNELIVAGPREDFHAQTTWACCTGAGMRNQCC